MFNFRLFAVCVVIVLVMSAGVLVWEASALQTMSASPTRESNGHRLLILERMNNADNLKQGSDIAPLPVLLPDEPEFMEKSYGKTRRR